MSIRIYLSDHDVRRIKSVVKTSDTFFLRIVNNEAMIIADDISYFKALTLEAKTSMKLSVSVNSDVLTSLTKGGVIEVVTEEDTLQFRFNFSDEELDRGFYRWISKVNFSTVEDIFLREYMRAIKAVDTTHFSIPILDNLKEIISVCTSCEVGIQICNGHIYSSGENLRMFKPIDDKDLNMALDLKSLKELERFGTEGVMHSAGVYFIINRDGYILGIRKARSVEIKYPPEFYQDDLAISRHVAKLGGSIELLKTFNTRLNKITPGKFKLNFINRVVEVDNGQTTFMVTMLCNELFGEGKVQTVTLDLASLKGLYKLLKDAEGIEVFNYTRIARIRFPNGINVLLRGEINR